MSLPGPRGVACEYGNLVLLPVRIRSAARTQPLASGTLVMTGVSASVWAAGAGMLVGTVLAIATWAVGAELVQICGREEVAEPAT